MSQDTTVADAHNLGAFYARKLIRAPAERAGVDLSYKQQTARLGMVADVVLHAYAITDAPQPVSTDEFLAAFKAGFFAAFQEVAHVRNEQPNKAGADQ